MAKHKVILGPVEHDGTIYQEGDDLTLPGDAAAALLAVGVIEAAEETRKSRAAGDVH
jgi:hypothetical protein